MTCILIFHASEDSWLSYYYGHVLQRNAIGFENCSMFLEDKEVLHFTQTCHQLQVLESFFPHSLDKSIWPFWQISLNINHCILQVECRLSKPILSWSISFSQNNVQAKAPCYLNPLIWKTSQGMSALILPLSFPPVFCLLVGLYTFTPKSILVPIRGNSRCGTCFKHDTRGTKSKTCKPQKALFKFPFLSITFDFAVFGVRCRYDINTRAMFMTPTGCTWPW